jgi:hypothetical protein
MAATFQEVLEFVKTCTEGIQLHQIIELAESREEDLEEGFEDDDWEDEDEDDEDEDDGDEDDWDCAYENDEDDDEDEDDSQLNGGPDEGDQHNLY